MLDAFCQVARFDENSCGPYVHWLEDALFMEVMTDVDEKVGGDMVIDVLNHEPVHDDIVRLVGVRKTHVVSWE